MSEDFPALERPKKANSGTPICGNCLLLIAPLMNSADTILSIPVVIIPSAYSPKRRA